MTETPLTFGGLEKFDPVLAGARLVVGVAVSYTETTEDPMAKTQWIPIGRGCHKADLEKIMDTLKEKWSLRYDYRIDKPASKDMAREPYRLLVRHR